MKQFEGKIILITGAASGIGKACAEYFAKEGALLALVDLNAEKFKEVLNEIKKNGAKDSPLVIVADVSSDSQRIINTTIDKYGRLDILINNAGIAHIEMFESSTVEKYDKIMAINTRAVFLLSQCAIPHLVKSKGNIVNVSSVAALRAVKGYIAYSMSKASVDQFTRCAALELAEKGVRVNAVNPGVINTSLLKTHLNEVDMAKYINMHPIGRIGQPEEVTNAIAFLAHEKAGFCTGVTLPVDGGISINSF